MQHAHGGREQQHAQAEGNDGGARGGAVEQAQQLLEALAAAEVVDLM
jgi:hypothetical protein